MSAAVNAARRRAWAAAAARHGALPGVRVADKVLKQVTCIRLDALAARPGHHLIYSVGWELGERERAAITQVPAGAWQIAIGPRGEVRERRADDACADRGCGHRRCWIEEAHVTELTVLLCEGPAGDQLTGWPATMRVFARHDARLRPPRAPASRAPR